MREQCSVCKGSGFVKYETRLCDACREIKCVGCNISDCERTRLWVLCEHCAGDGEVEAIIKTPVTQK